MLLAQRRNGLNVLPKRKRARHKPKRYNRPVPGDRVQMDSCKIRAGPCQFTAIDDCSRFLVAGLARRRSAAATLAFLDRVLEKAPFPVQRIQTERGTVFFADGAVGSPLQPLITTHISLCC